MLKIVVLVSGSGTNLQAIINAINAKKIAAEIALVLSDKPNAYGLVRAENANIPALSMEPKDYHSREAYDTALAEVIADTGAELIVLAGFMRILGEAFVERFCERIINIHPALLPAFPGLNAQKQAWEYGVKVSGCTVHIVDSGMDTGPIIAQNVVPVLAEDTADSLAARILIQEHIIYPEVIGWWAENRIKVVDGKVVVNKE